MKQEDHVRAVSEAVKVLVVDDLSQNLFAMEKILQTLPIEIVTASSGNEALSHTLRHEFGLILMDVQMPEMDGFETATLIRQNDSTRSVPIIFVTAISKDDKYVFEGYESGAVDYLFKPIDSSILLSKVRVFVDLARSKQELKRVHRELLDHVEQQKKMEVELRLAQKLEAVGQLAAGIAHEINTPMQYIGDNVHFVQHCFAGYRALLGMYQEVSDALSATGGHDALLDKVKAAEKRTKLEYLSKQVPDALEGTLEGVDHVCGIVRAMKEFAHPDQGKRNQTDINRALKSVLTVARSEYKFIADVETDFGELPLVVCYPSDINQVFLNLIVNAAHAVGDSRSDGDAKGQIRIRTCKQEDGTALITVSDSGCGIPEGIRQRVFDPFFTTKEVGRGTGQGLAIARSVVVDKHGGSLTFESEVGHGTTFFVRLPVNGAEAEHKVAS